MTEAGDDSGLLDRAIDWVALLRSGRATTDDAEQLQRWRAMHPAHEAAFRQAARLYRDLGTMGAELERRKVRSFVPRTAVTRRALIGGALAASVAAYMVVKPPLEMWPSLAEMSADYRTAKGEQLDVALADNVSLKLNTLTSVAVRGDGISPRIELISGEAAITSQRSLSEPLVVIAADGHITSSAGEVNIRCIDGVVLATCLQGSITVTRGGRSVELRSGQQIAYSASEPLGLPAPIADSAILSAWREKLLIFKDKPLATVVSEINRYRPGKIMVTNSDLGQRLVNGTFHTDKLDDFVAQVRQLYAVKVRALPGGVVLLS
ncbi:FecR family protein [Tardiphaga sp.]|uniref:FecR family protein n=1 Tax=Tardiphaga sp. TaxID=1926292 RepID=UPI0037DA030B